MSGRKLRMARALAVAAVLGCVAGPGWAQVKAGSDTGLGLTGADVPQLLKDVQADPYKAPAAPACGTIPDEIVALNKLLGPDLGDEEKAKAGAGDKAAGVARSLVPYGGVVRLVTGASKKDKALREAVLAGYARRGYLRGVESGLSCAPAPTPTVAAAVPAPAAAKPAAAPVK
jgi:hypothetical protein